MLGTKEGRAFIGRYMAEGQSLDVGGEKYIFNSTGDRAKDRLWLRSSEMRANGLNRTFTKDMKKELNQVGTSDNIVQGVNQVIDLKIGLEEKKATMTLGHEAFVHADVDADRLNAIDKKAQGGAYNSTSEYINDVYNVSSSGVEDHKALGRGEVAKYENYSNELTKQNNDTYYREEYLRDVNRHNR